jgi:hypothetical protein
MSKGQTIVAAKVDVLTPSFVEPMRGMPLQACTSDERFHCGATCFFLQFARSAAGMHFGAVRSLLRLVW